MQELQPHDDLLFRYHLAIEYLEVFELLINLMYVTFQAIFAFQIKLQLFLILTWKIIFKYVKFICQYMTKR